MEPFDAETELALRYRAKAFLRQRARALRGSIPRGAILERSRRICETLAGLPVVEAAGSVALFYPIEGRNEVDLTGLDARLRELGKRVAYPTIHPETRVMTFRFPPDLASLAERGMGFLEPPEGAEEASRLDVIVVPALQIDERGYRVGYGAGYYDRTLPRFSPPACSIGVAFSFQLIPEVPVTEGDVAVALVVTDDRVYRVAPGA